MLEVDKKRQKEEFNAMGRDEKIAYVWDYYKWGIIAAGVILLGIIYIIATPPKPKMETSVNITFIGEWVNTNGAEEFAGELNRNLPGLSTEKQSIDVQTFAMGESADPMMTMGNMQKLAANIVSSEIDVLVGDEAQMIKYAGGESALPFDDLFSKEEQEAMKFISFSYQPDSIDGSKQEPYQVTYIDLSSSIGLKKMIPSEKIGMIVLSNSTRTEEARQLMNYLLTLE